MKEKMGKCISVLLLLMIALGVIAMTSKYVDHRGLPFRFEDYETDAEAQKALLALHPIGSEVQALRATLEKAGAVYKPIINPEYKDDKNFKNIVIYEYRTGLFKWNGWNVDIKVKQEKIARFKVYKTYQGL